VEETVSSSARPWTVLSEMPGLFAAMGLILAAIGIYGVISYASAAKSLASAWHWERNRDMWFDWY